MTTPSTPSSIPGPVSALALLLSTLPAFPAFGQAAQGLKAPAGLTQGASTAAPGSPGYDTNLRDLGYGANVTVKGIFPTHTFWFPKPPGTTVLGKGSMLRLRLQHSSALLPKSTVTVLVDDVPVFSRFLNVPRETWFDMNIPLADLRTREDQRLIKVELRFFSIVSEDPCQDLSNPALWAAIHNDSLLHLDVTVRDRGLGLADLRGIYSDRTSAGVTLVLPDKIGSEEVPAAVWLTAWVHGLVEASGSESRFSIVRRTQYAKEDRPHAHVIFMGTIAELSEYLLAHPALQQSHQAEFNRLFDQAAEIENGDALLLVGGTQAESHLFVTGRDALGLRQAARYLTDSEQGPFTGREIVIHRLQTRGPPGTRVPPYQVSLRRLGYVDQQVRGVATHLIRMNFKRADLGENVRNVSFTAGGAHSSFLDGSGSSMTILFNQVPIKGVSLKSDSGRIDAIRVDLPDDLMNSGTNSLEVAFDLTVQSKDCTRVWFDQAWATLSADSYFEVHKTEAIRSDNLDFTQFPDPFLSETGLLLPEDPDPWELKAAAWMLAALEQMGGTRFNSYTKVYTFGEWRHAATEVQNLIAIALTMDRMGSFRAVVRPPMQTRGRDIELVNADRETIYSARTVDPLGLAQLFPNPTVSSSGAVLLLHATTSPSMLGEVAQLFADEGRVKKVTGNVIILDQQLGWHHYDVGSKITLRGGVTDPPWYAGVVKYRTWLLPPALVLLAFLLAAVYRKTRGIRIEKRT
jgi:cellulose synthase subunit